MKISSAIIFINQELNETSINSLKSQLSIDEIISDSEFNQRILDNPSYPDIIHLNHIILLVTQTSISNMQNSNLADVVLLFKNGLVYVEQNKFGPPSKSFPLERLYLNQLI